MIPELPADLTAVPADELQALLDELLALADRIYEGDAELVDGMTNDEVIAMMEDVVGRVTAVRAEVEAREAAATETRARLDELHGEVLPVDAGPNQEPAPDEGDDGDGQPAEGEPAEQPAEDAPAEPQAEPVSGEVLDPAPEALPVAASTRRPYVSQTRVEVREPDDNTAPLVAAMHLPGYNVGQKIDSLEDLAKAVIKARSGFGNSGDGEKIVVASSHREFPSDRVLSGDDPIHTMEQIYEVVGGPVGTKKQTQALAASGGLCAPTEVRYGLDVLGVTDEPVGASLPSFQAARGGIRYTFAPTLANITTGIANITSAQDLAGYVSQGGTTPDKPCQTISCPSFVEVLIEAVARCLKFGNFNARTYPELVTAWTDLMAIAVAQTKEVKRLDAIKAGSTAVATRGIGSGATVSVPVLGAFPEFLHTLLVLVAAWKSRWRLAEGIRLRALLPRWVPDALLADEVIRNRATPNIQTRDDVIAAIRATGVDPVFYLDSPTGAAMMFGAQAAGTASDWHDTMQWGLYPEGTWIELDGGAQDFGVIRDSSLIRTNDYMLFAEEFFNLARVGPQSLWLTTDFTVSGSTVGSITPPAAA